MPGYLKHIVDKCMPAALAGLLWLAGLNLTAQSYPIALYNGQTVSTCSGTFFDAGGAFAGYTFNEDYTITFCSSDPLNTHIKLYFSFFNVHPGDTLYLFDGPSTASPLIGAFNNSNSPSLQPFTAGITNPGGCLTARFRSDNLNNASGWEAEISCNTVCQTVIAAFDSLQASHLPDDSGYIDICRGEVITFAGTGLFPFNQMTYPQADSLSTFVWEFGDGSTDTGMVVIHPFDSAIGYNVNLRILDDHGCMSTNSLGIRVRTAGNPLRQIAPIPDLCLGDTAHLLIGPGTANHLMVKPIHHKQTASLVYDSLTFIPDGGATGGQCYNATVTFNLFDPNQTVLDSADILAVRMNAEHSWVGDLKISLICPTGQSIILKDYIQNGPADLGVSNLNDCLLPWCVNQANMNPPGTGWTYTWSMSPQNGVMNDYVTLGQIDSSSYLPDQSFSNLAGCPLNGTWTLEVCDYWAYDNGYVFWWGLEIDPALIPEAWEYTVPIDSILYSGPGILAQNDSSLLLSPSGTGDQAYQMTIWDGYGCSYDTSFSIKVNPLPATSLPPDTVYCPGEPLPLLQAADAGPGATYAWSFNGSHIANGISYHPLQAGQYTLHVLDSNGCQDADSILVTQAQAPQWSASSEPASCGYDNGQAWVHTPDSMVSIVWNTLPPLAGPSIIDQGPGLYHFSVVDGPCTYDDTISIGGIPPPQWDVAQLEDENCGQRNGSVSLHLGGGHPPYSVEWLTSPVQYGTKAGDLASGTVFFVLRDSLCTIYDSVHIGRIPGSEAGFSFLPSVAEMPEAIYYFRDESEPGVVTWWWDFGDGMGFSTDRNPVYAYQGADSFRVTLVTADTAGCMDTVVQSLLVRDFMTLYIPNAFTPNGDGLNDGFGPIGQNLEIERYEMEIFDRWGKQVFRSGSFDVTWNGRLHNQGEVVPGGAYIYRILIKVRHRPLQQYRGTVTIY